MVGDGERRRGGGEAPGASQFSSYERREDEIRESFERRRNEEEEK